MTDERAIRRIEELLGEVTKLGGQNERTSIVSNLTVVDAAPAGLTNFITIADERDGDTILAKTVPGIIYAVSDKVNVLFVEGTEPIAFQQGSESPSSGLWGIVPSTSTDIFYNGGDVGIGKSVAPNASLEVLSTAQAQLRLTHTEDTKFVDFTLDTNHDLTVTPSSTGQIILQPTTDQTNFFQVLDADGGDPVFNVDVVNERVSVGIAAPSVLFHAQKDQNNPTVARIQNDTDDTDAYTGLTMFTNMNSSAQGINLQAFSDSFNTFTGIGGLALAGYARIRTDSQVNGFILNVSGSGDIRLGTNNLLRAIIDSSGDMAINNVSPQAQLHVDQTSLVGNQPVLLLDQADLTDEMIEFVTTIGTGNPIEAIGAKTLTTTHFIKVTIPGGLTRYFPVGTIA